MPDHLKQDISRYSAPAASPSREGLGGYSVLLKAISICYFNFNEISDSLSDKHIKFMAMINDHSTANTSDNSRMTYHRICEGIWHPGLHVGPLLGADICLKTWP